MSVLMARTVTIAMNVGFDGQNSHDSHVSFKADTITIAMNVGFNGQNDHDSHECWFQ